eukprot:TRINITY_DN2227_c0_g1_i1.p1 TRINITY_DN2227_c0_g1~~TRINITY_DN2227_c0_g1_i1.p1  ORF type:complete len:118 (-),score=24.01 TRINITY_DN2227_c0_g1_i1:270-623(-)
MRRFALVSAIFAMVFVSCVQSADGVYVPKKLEWIDSLGTKNMCRYTKQDIMAASAEEVRMFLFYFSQSYCPRVHVKSSPSPYESTVTIAPTCNSTHPSQSDFVGIPPTASYVTISSY